MTESDQSISLGSLFSNIEKYFILGSEIESNIGTNTSNFDESKTKVIDDILLCLELVEKYGIFSKNEDLDDYSTSSLKYLGLRYYLGKAHNQVSDTMTRYNHLRQAKIAYESFIQQCIKSNIIKGKDLGYDEDGLEDEDDTPDMKRKRKIESFKKNREIQQRIQILKQILSSSSSSIGEDREDEEREYRILQLQMYVREAANDLPMITQEMQLLQHKADLEDSDNVPIEPKGTLLDEGLGISVTRITKIGDQLVTSREQIKANVFKPRMEGPSISLEEYGDIVKEQTLTAATVVSTSSSKESEDTEVRRYKELQEAGEEDNEDLVDQATMADRDWDAFKEANPKGWGNKMGKRY